MKAGLKMSDVRGLPAPDVRQRVEQLRQEIHAIRVKGNQGTVEQPHRIRLMKREIARCLTALNEVGS